MTDQGARADALTELLRDVRADETALPVLSVAPFSSSGRIWIDGERIRYTGVTQGDPSYFTGCTRGADVEEGGAAARPHSGGDYVWQDNRTTRAASLALVNTSSAWLDGVFTPSFRNYQVTIDGTVTTAGNLYLVGRTAGIPNTSLDYISREHRIDLTSGAETLPGTVSANSWVAILATVATIESFSIDVVMSNPLITAVPCSYKGQSVFSLVGTGAGLFSSRIMGMHDSIATFDGIQVVTDGGLLNGQLSVRGLD